MFIRKLLLPMRYIFLVRAHHWVKNFFLFIPAFFSGDILNVNILIVLIQGFFCFCMVSSAVYIFNDYRDRELDRHHPIKKNRPIASGKVSPSFALSLMVAFMVLGFGWAYYLKSSFFWVVFLYFVINVVYSLGLKNIGLLDIFLVSTGFVLRVIAGGLLVSIFLSQWLIIMVFLLALLLTFAKRRDDLILAKKSGEIQRLSAKGYTLEYINICLSIISGVIMVSYIMYTLSEEVQERIGDNYLYITSLFVFGGILRYLQITLVNERSGSPTRIFLTDRFIQAMVIGWGLSFLIIIYIL